MRLFPARLVNIFIATVFLVALYPTSTASAQPSTADAAEKRATELWKKATAQYDLGNFEKAVELYKKGYEEAPAPFFLYNIAQSYRQLGDCQNAIFFYKRYLSRARYSATRDEKVEQQVAERIKDLEENCKQTEEIKKRPPEKPMPADGNVSDTGRDGGDKDPPKDPVKGDKDPPKDPPKDPDKGDKNPPDKDVAAADDDDDDDYDDDDDDGYDRPIAGVSTMVYQPTKVSSSVELGGAFLPGFVGELKVPTQFSIRLGAGYPMAFGKVATDFGVLLNLTPIPWDNRDYDGGVEGTAMLTSLLANVGASYPVMKNLSIRAEFGLGLQLFSGLARGNPFTEGNVDTSGALSVFNLRIAVGAEYSVTKNIVVTASPLVYSYSPAPDGMVDEVESLTRFDLLVGAGYKL